LSAECTSKRFLKLVNNRRRYWQK